MRLLKNPSFSILLALLCAGALVGLPKLTEFGDDIESNSQQLNELTQQVETIRFNQRLQATQLSQQDASFKTQRKRENILNPVFQITGDTAVGSAVLVKRVQTEDESYYLALSCYHVIRDILEEQDGPGIETVFEQDREQPLFVQGIMVAYDADVDLALIRIDTKENLGQVAKLAPRSRTKSIATFTEIYTVGCPLGTPVQATSGEISREDWSMEDEDYWMISTPAYFGNSGGGVFLAETCELIGIFSKIYTHGSFQPQVITHMGLAVPIDVIHDWLDEVGFEISKHE
ncbi:MAG: S1-C subfamily serine protease [Myxococcota bacterium]